MTEQFIPPHGGYKGLLSFQKAEIVYDATVRFCADLLAKRDRTVDQVVQAARSGKQNIVGASMASGTSKETEIKLTNVARASLEELLTDYRDFLRTRGFAEWPKDHPYVKRLQELNRTEGANYETFRKAVENPDNEERGIYTLRHSVAYRPVEAGWRQESGQGIRHTGAEDVVLVRHMAGAGAKALPGE
jgi:hypothetical protein